MPRVSGAEPGGAVMHGTPSARAICHTFHLRGLMSASGHERSSHMLIRHVRFSAAAECFSEYAQLPTGYYVTPALTLAAHRSLVLRLEFAQPSLNVCKKVRIRAMWAGQQGNRSRQSSEALCIQIDAGVDFAPRCWAVEFEQCHRTLTSKSRRFAAWGFQICDAAGLAAPDRGQLSHRTTS